MALRTVLLQTPANAPMWSRARSQAFVRTSGPDLSPISVTGSPPTSAICSAITAITACSANVSLQAICGGIQPLAAQERRRSIEAGVLGREPERALVGFLVAPAPFWPGTV